MDMNNELVEEEPLSKRWAKLFLTLQKAKQLTEGMAADTKPVDMVGAFVALRDAKAHVKKTVDGILADHFGEPMDKLEDAMRDFMQTNGIKGIPSNAGTAYLYKATSVTTADGAAFRRHVIGAQDWDIADWKPNKTRVNELVEGGESPPPGVNYSAFMKVGVRRPGEKE